MIADVLNQKRSLSEAYQKISIIKDRVNSEFPNDHLLKSKLSQITGNYYYLTGRLDSAMFYLTEANKLRFSINSQFDSSFAYAFGKLGNCYYVSRDFDSAYYYYSEALRLSSTKKDPDNYEVSSYYEGRGIALTGQGLYAEAEKNFLQSLEISRKYMKESDPALGRLYLNLGVFYYRLTKNEDAYTYFKEAERIFSSALDKHNPDLGTLYWNIGNYCISIGDYSESINYLEQAYFVLSQYYTEEYSLLKDLIMDIGVAYEKKGDLKQAIRYFKLSIEGNNTPSVIKSYRNLANAYREFGDLHLARESYLQSIEAAKSFPGKDHDLALCYRYFGEFLIKSMNDQRGLSYYALSLDILNTIFKPDHEDIGRIFMLYAEYYLAESRLERAREYSEKALQTMDGLNKISDTLDRDIQISSEQGLFLTEALDLKARIYLSLYHRSGKNHFLEECLETIESSIHTINTLRMSYSMEESKLLLMNKAKNTINTGITAAFNLYLNTGEKKYAHKVFELSERSKSIVLLNSLRGLEALKMSGIPDHLMKQEKKLKGDLLSYNSLIYKEKLKNEPDDKKILTWQSTAFEIKKQYDSLVTSFETSYPSFYQLKYDNSVISPGLVMDLIGPDQAVIEYARTDSVFYVSVVLANEVQCLKIIDQDDSLAHAMADFTRLLRVNTFGNYNREDYMSYIRSAYFIYQKLLEPLEGWILDKRLIIIPDGELGYLSFDALITSKPVDGDPDYRSVDYLVFRHPVSYSSSATILFGADKKVVGNITQGLLAFAPTYSADKEGSTLRSSEPGIDSLRLLPIKGVEEEVNRIIKIFNGREYNGETATELNFKKHAGEYNVLHLAMHTLIDENNPLFSKMVFTSGGSQEEDGLLNTYELFSLDLQGRLGVLSACNTGSGKLERGEGIMSLARGFIYAGIPSLIMTLWEIDDQPSSDIMVSFYEYLKEGMPTDVALQLAKVDYITASDKFKSHPTYWAGFVNIGKSVLVDQHAKNTRYYWFLAAVILLLITFFSARQVYWRKKKD